MAITASSDDTNKKQQEVLLEPAATAVEEKSHPLSQLTQQEIDRRVIDRERQRQREEEKEKRAKEEEKVNILLIGSKHLASHIVYALRNYARFTIIDRTDPLLVFQNPYVAFNMRYSDVQMFQFSEYDLEQNLPKILDINNYDFIINTHSIHASVFSATNPVQTMYTNCVWTQALMNSILKSKNSNASILHISTDKVYGDQGVPPGIGASDSGDMYHKKFMIKEIDSCNPLGIKAISRYNQELIFTQMAKTYGLRYMVFRVGTMYGKFTPRDNIMNSMIISAMRDSVINLFGDQYASRDLVDVEEVAHITKRVLIDKYDSSVWDEIYNIGGCYPTRMYVSGLAQFIAAMLAGYPILSKDYDYIKPYLSIRLKTLPPRCFEDTKDAGIRMWLDCEKAKKKIGFDPTLRNEWQNHFKEVYLWALHYYLNYSQDQVQETRLKIQR